MLTAFGGKEQQRIAMPVPVLAQQLGRASRQRATQIVLNGGRRFYGKDELYYAACSSCTPLLRQTTSSAQTEVLNLGGVIISVSDSRTAQVFHIVDQMSQWDSGVHHGYVRWATRTLNLRPRTKLLDAEKK
jgi:hypothetical protein